LKVIPVVQLSWEERVASTVITQLLEESGMEIIKVSRLENVATLKKTLFEVLGERKDSTGIPDHVEVGRAEDGVEFSEVLDGRVDKGVDFLRDFRPGAQGKLLPNSDISLWAVHEHLDSSHADHGVFTLVKSNRNKDGEDLLLDVFIIDDDIGNTVNLVVIIVWGIFSFTGNDDVLKGEDGL